MPVPNDDDAAEDYRPSRIEDYALIGDCQTAALVGRNGSIDWCCFPRFDSGACFAALLGTGENGRWGLAPAGKIQSVIRRYRPGSLILETDFQTDDGAVTIIDFMAPRTRAPGIVRIAVGRHGRVRMAMQLLLRFDYGSIVPWVQKLSGHRGIRATAGPDTAYVLSPTPLVGQDLTTLADFEIAAGQRVPFTLAWAPTHEPQPDPWDAEDALHATEQWWSDWSSRCTYRGKWTEAVSRSLVTLKALTYVPSGGIVAAATTSLPERLGGQRNWDYRYCWLRDATFTLLALDVGGYTGEAKAWRQWLVNAVAGTPDDLQIMYGLSGERRLGELELDWLPGYANSKPVRIGNAAYMQRQLDVFGELMDALFQSRKMGLGENNQMWSIERHILKFLEHNWQQPDDGIWEIRGQRRNFTLSKVMAWVAFDRAVKTIEQFRPNEDATAWRRARDEIHAQVCAQGFNTSVNAFTQYYGSADADASLLMLPLVGFLPATDRRILGTIDRIQKTLMDDGLLRRYPHDGHVDGLPGREGVFLLCTFWLADNLVLAGRRKEAEAIFERLLALRNDVGLLSEEYDTAGKRFLGNFPQAFSHVGLINSAKNLSAPAGPAHQRAEAPET